MPVPIFLCGTPVPMDVKAFRGAATVLVVLALVMAREPLASAAPVTLDAVADATQWNGQRKVARDSLGRVYVAARVPDGALGVAVHVFRSGDSGVTWSPLPRNPDASSEMSRASLAMDSRDRLHLTWTERLGSDLQVFHAVWSGSWGPRTQISFTPGYSGFPAIGADRQDRIHLAWYGFDGATYQVYYRLRAANATWGATETVSTGLRDANNPSLAIGPDDRPHVAWFLFTGAQWFVVHAEREDRWRAITTLSDVANRALDPSLAVTSAGDVVAAWTEQAPNGTRSVSTAIRSGTMWGNATALGWFAAPGGHPSVAVDGYDTALVFWDQLDSSVRYRAWNGTWGPETIIPAGGIASFPNARWASVANPLWDGANRIDVVWTEDRGGVFAVGFDGVDVRAAGTPPERPSGDWVPWMMGLGVGGVVLVCVLVVLRRRRPRQP